MSIFRRMKDIEDIRPVEPKPIFQESDNIQIRMQEHPKGKVIFVSGRLDANTSSVLEIFLKKNIPDNEKSVILDFRSLEFISSAGLRVCVATKKRVKSLNLVISKTSGVYSVFDLSGIALAMNIQDTIDDIK